MATIKARRTVTLKGEVLKLADLKEVVHQAVLLGMPDDSEVRIMAGLGVTITAPLDPPPSLDDLELPDNPTLADVVTATAEALGVDPGQLKEAVAAALGVEYAERNPDKARQVAERLGAEYLDPRSPHVFPTSSEVVERCSATDDDAEDRPVEGTFGAAVEHAEDQKEAGRP